MKALLILMMIVSLNSFALELPIVKVKDGDTIATRIETMPEGLQDYSVRVRGIDTPEKGSRAKCEREAAQAIRATNVTKEIVKGHKTMKLTNCEHDKYGGRMVCNVYVGGVDVAKTLLDAKLAKPYDGGKKSSWCD